MATGILPALPLPFDEFAGLDVMPIVSELVLSPLPMAKQCFMRKPHRWCRAFIRGDEQPRRRERIDDRTGSAARRKAIEWCRSLHSDRICDRRARGQRP